MKKLLYIVGLTLGTLPAMAQESKTVYNFLRLPVSAHVAALGGENITISDDDAALAFHNPALLNNVGDRTLGLNMMTYMEGCVTGSASFAKAWGERGTWAAGGQFMSYGTMRETNANGEQVGEFSAKDISLAGTFTYALTNRISGGITAKAIASYIGSYNSMAVGVDLGFNYYDSDKQWSVSAVARNLGGQLKAYEDDFERLPLDLQIGVTKRLVGSPLRLSASLVRLNDWEYGIGRHLVVGADLILSEQFYVAAGYNALRAAEMSISDDEGSSAHGAGLSVGAGMHLQRLSLHLAYARYHVSSNSLLINFSYSL